MSVWRFFFVCLLFCFLPGFGQSSFKGSFYNKENKISLVIDFEKESVNIPGFSFLGQTHGFMNGNIYGVWMITKIAWTQDKKVAIVHFANDYGSEAQKIRMTLREDSILTYKVMDTPVIKKIVDNKLVKIPTELVFLRTK